MPEMQTVYPTGRFTLGGRVYLRDEPMKGLTDEEVAFYLSRGTVNTQPPKKGGLLTRIVDHAPVDPTTKPATEVVGVIVPEKTEAEVSAAAMELANKQRRAMEAVGAASKGKGNGR